jgi:hypothetical protein
LENSFYGLHTPDASARLITIWMRSWHFVVGDDLVVPIDDVDAAVGAVGEGDGAEEGIVAGDEVGELGELPIRAVAMHGDGLNLRDDGIGDGHRVGGLESSPALGDSQRSQHRLKPSLQLPLARANLIRSMRGHSSPCRPCGSRPAAENRAGSSFCRASMPPG